MVAGELDDVGTREAYDFESHYGQALRAQIVAGQDRGANLLLKFHKPIEREPEEIYVQYELFLDNDWRSLLDGGESA